MSDNPTERTYFLQTISMYKELVREVILKTFQFAIHSEDISQFLSSHETKIKLQEFIRNGIFNKADSNKLQTLNPNPDKFDIALLIKLIIYLGDIDEPERGWHTDPNPTDESTGADLIRLKNIRNKFLAHDPNEAKLSKDECERVFAKVKAILTRILAKIDHESKESLNERLLEYRQLNVVTEKSEIKQYIEELSAVYKKNEKRMKEVEELAKTVKELKLYFEKTPELYVRYGKLLNEGGRVVLRGFLEKEVAKVEKDLATLLFENRPTLMAQVHSDFHEKMFGGNNNYQLDPASWDIDLLVSVIVILSPNLSEDDASNIRFIQNARRDYSEHALIYLDSADLIPYWTDLVSSLTSLSASLERGKKSEVKCLIDRYKNKIEDADADRYFRELTHSRVATQTLTDFYKERVARLMKYLKELEENGQKVKKEYLNLDLKLMVDCKNEKTRELVEDVLEEHFKASLAKSKIPVNCIRKETDSLLHKITANPTVTITGVKRGCIILSLRTSTIHGLLYLIQLFESQQFRSILDSLSAELYYLYGEAFLLQGHIPFECLDRVLQQFKGLMVHIISDSIAKDVGGIWHTKVIAFHGIYRARVTARIQNVHFLVSKPFTIIHVGTNDINSRENYSVDEIISFFNNLITLIRRINIQTHIVFSSILPRPCDYLDTSAKVKQVNKLLECQSKERNCQFIHSFKFVALFVVKDKGLHLNLEGTRLLRRFFH